jgi:DNA-binding transcriptional LysR family regulator
MDIDDVRTFVAVADAGSISRAAAELHLTQPAVTRRVQRFEDQVGARLLDRRTRPFVVTDVGRATLERCRRLLTAVGELTTVTRQGLEPAGELRIGVAHALTEIAIDRAVDHLRRAFPAVALRLRTGWSRDLLARVKSGALEGAIVLLPEDARVPAGLTAESVANESLVVVAAKNWRPKTTRLADLADMGWVLNPDGCAARAALHDALAQARLPLRVNVEAYDYELQLALVARGRGLGLVPARLLRRSRSRTRIRPLHSRQTRFPFTIWMVTGEVPPSLQATMGALKAAIAASLSQHR